MAAAFGRYEIERELGRGASGIVYLATDPVLRRKVAIKVLVIPHTVQGEARAQAAERFTREARAVAAIQHPSIPQIYEVGEIGGRHFIAMEYCEGQTLRDTLAIRGVMPAAEAMDIVRQVLSALHAAHQRGIVHRDVKPENVMLSPGKAPLKLMDFGIARSSADATLTQTGSILGTPSYMAPEQVLGKPVDARTDLFAVAVMLHELLTNRKPFRGSTITEVTHAIVYTEPQLLATLPPPLLGVLQRGLAKNPADRFQSALEMGNAFNGVPVVSTPSNPAWQVPGPNPPRPSSRVPSSPAFGGATSANSGSTPPNGTVVGPPPSVMVPPPPVAAASARHVPADLADTPPVCGFGIRFGARLLDSFFLWVINALFLVCVGGWQAYWASSFKGVGSPYFWYLIGLGAIYEIGLTAYNGQTLGKRVAGIRVMSAEGEAIGFGPALLRHVGSFVSSLPCGLGYLWVAIDLRKQGFHDKIAGTIVVPVSVGNQLDGGETHPAALAWAAGLSLLLILGACAFPQPSSMPFAPSSEAAPQPASFGNPSPGVTPSAPVTVTPGPTSRFPTGGYTPPVTVPPASGGSTPDVTLCRACGGTGRLGRHAECEGTGRCSTCGGSGRQNTACFTCRGTGVEQCDHCDGTGFRQALGMRCSFCSGTGRIRCVICGGAGREECYSCSGTGKCRECRGTGKDECEQCHGTGHTDGSGYSPGFRF